MQNGNNFDCKHIKKINTPSAVYHTNAFLNNENHVERLKLQFKILLNIT